MEGGENRVVEGKGENMRYGRMELQERERRVVRYGWEGTKEKGGKRGYGER